MGGSITTALIIMVFMGVKYQPSNGNYCNALIYELQLAVH